MSASFVHLENGSKSRWEMLRKAVLTKKLDSSDVSHSVRHFTSFGLFDMKRSNGSNNSLIHAASNTDCLWFSYTCKDIIKSKSIWIQHPSPKTNLQDLASFNNTGNVCIWPAEEVLAYYCTLHSKSFEGKSIIELGGGSSCLAGLGIAVNTCSPATIVLTDGNLKCVQSVQTTLEMNSASLRDVDVSASLFRWDNTDKLEQLAGKFDYVICADCLFFDPTRESLVKAIYELLKPGGCGLVFAPRRGNTLTQFVDMCRECFSAVNEYEHYCCRITNCHKHELKSNRLYKPDIHFPIFIELIKNKS